MNLENSAYLWLFLVIPCYLFYSYISHREARKWLYRFAHVKRRGAPFIVSTIFFSLALAAIILSLAEPRVQYSRVVFNRSGIDVAIGIDVSKSMLAEDENIPEEGKRLFDIPNRLNRARYYALNIINALHGERSGVFIFASKGVSIVPLTNDYGYCQYVLKHVNDSTITIPGSDLAQAISTGVSLFEGVGRKTVKAIVLISDGEDINDDNSPLYEAAQRAAIQGIAIYTVGIGRGQGVLIPIRDYRGIIDGYYLDEDGTYLKTRLEPDTLKSISSVTGGLYFHPQYEQNDESIVDAILKRARTIEYTRATEPTWFHLSPLLLCAAFILFAAGFMVGR